MQSENIDRSEGLPGRESWCVCSGPDLTKEAGSVPRASSQPSRGKQPVAKGTPTQAWQLFD